jgi:putative FmdB family regulatory protein
MPIYEYRCKNCGTVYEKIVPSSSAPAPECPQCGSKEIEKLISAPGACGTVGSPVRSGASASCGAGFR